MSMYFTSKVVGDAKPIHELVRCHTQLPFVATAWSSNRVIITTEDGGRISVITRTAAATSMAWHPQHPILVIGWRDGQMTFWEDTSHSDNAAPSKATNEGDTLKAPGHESLAVTTLCWTSGGNVLLSTSKSGAVCVWQLESSSGGKASEAQSPENKQLQRRLVIAWTTKVEMPVTDVLHLSSAAGGVGGLAEHHVRPNAASITRRISPTNAPSSTRGDDEIAFVMITSSNIVYSMDDSQKINRLITFEKDFVVAHMVWDCHRRKLFTLSTTNHLSVHAIDEELKSTAVINKRKVDVGPEADLVMLTVCWAPGNVIAISSGENAIHFYDFDKELMYSLRLPEVDGAASPDPSHQVTGDDLTSIVATATSAKHAGNIVSSLRSFTNVNNNAPSCHAANSPCEMILAAGTTNGKIFMWQYVSRKKGDGSSATAVNLGAASQQGVADGGEYFDTAESWVPLTYLEVDNCAVESLRVLSSGGLVATTAGSVSLVQEAFRRRRWCSPAAVVQANPESVVISLCNTTTYTPSVENTTEVNAVSSYSVVNIVVKTQIGKVREADIVFPQMALWNGQKLDVYTINEATGTTKLLHSTEYFSSMLAMHTDGIFKVARDNPNRIVFENYNEHILANMNFAESEGIPNVIDCCGDFVCVATNKNFMKVARVSTRELRQIGPCRLLFQDTNGITIRSCKVSPKGKMVALLVNHHSPGTVKTAVDAAVTGSALANTTGTSICTQPSLLTGDYSTKVFVYDLDTDKIKWYDFGIHNDIPEAVFWNTPLIEESCLQTGFPGAVLSNATSPIGGTTQLDLEGLLLAVETKAQLVAAYNQQKHAADQLSSVSHNTSVASPARDVSQNTMDGCEVSDIHADEAVALSPQRFDKTHLSLQQRRNAVTLFVAPGIGGVSHQPGSGGIVLHHSAPLKQEQVCLIGCSVPFLVLSSVVTHLPPQGDAAKTSSNAIQPQDLRVERVKMRDFQGMGVQAETDKQLRDALMRFGYYTTLGSMDEAYKAIKSVKDTSVWCNLARMCVATKRLDVAEVCLANMQDGVAARMLRESTAEPEIETRLGILALSLGMTDEAVEFFKVAKRPDMITRLLLAANRWDDAQAHTQVNDHIRIYAVAYQRAQFIENNNLGIDNAIKYYEKAQCAGSDVPRLLMQMGQMDELKNRVAAAKKRLTEVNEKEGYQVENGGVKSLANADIVAAMKGDTPDNINANRNARDLLLWWAQYLESIGDITNALQYYEIARDVFNVVRILCVQLPPKIEQAIQIVSNQMKRNNIGVAYFVGRYYEDQGNSRLALQYLTMAGANKRAVRLAKSAEMYGDVVAIVLQSNDKALAAECAKYFDDRGMYDRAAQLYQKEGDTQRAIDVCIKGGLFDQLHQISESLDSAADPETFISMAEHFINSKHYEKAVSMLVFAKAYNEALQLCHDKDVKLTDEMAEAMTLPKSEVPEEEEYRMNLLKRIANVAKDQGSYHLACKKFTQAGERVKALKMLLKAGDTEKVIFFANHSRSPEIYVLAANFLQSQKWHTDLNIYKTIVTFYTKAKNFESLALFYDSCAQLQIDEYRDYDKALSTLQEALKVLEKSDIPDVKKQNFAQRVEVVEKFVTARRLIQPGQESPQTVSACQDLLVRSRPSHNDHDLIDSAIRIGDVYALLVEYFDKLGKFEEAYTSIEQMRGQEIEISYYLEAGLVEKVCKKLGRDPNPLLTPIVSGVLPASGIKYSGGGEDEGGEFVEEDV